MCCIVDKPKGKTLSNRSIKLLWECNSDGVGIVLPQTKPEMIKGIMSLDDLYKVLKIVDKFHCLIHFRMATHGSVTPENTHPFPMGKNRFLMHNGILTQYGSSGDKGKSDSAHLADDLAPLPSDAIRRILNTITGKFAFIDQGNVSLHGFFDEHAGKRFSNMHWLPTLQTRWTSIKTGFTSSYNVGDGSRVWNTAKYWDSEND